MENSQNFRPRFNEILKEKGLIQTDLANKSGLTRGEISKIINKSIDELTVAELKLFCELTDISFFEFFNNREFFLSQLLTKNLKCR